MDPPTDAGATRLSEEELRDLTERIIGRAFTVANELGAGFLEKVYENALTYELKKRHLHAERQHKVPVYL